MDCRKRHPLLPGYASKAVEEGKLPSFHSDIYSFGVTFFVLLHHSFPEPLGNPSKLDEILLRCCKTNENQSYPSFQEVENALHSIQDTKKKRIYKRSGWFLFMGMVCFVVGLWCLKTWNQSVDLRYLEAMRLQDYTLAMDIKATEIEPYQLMLKEAKGTKGEEEDKREKIKEVLWRMEELMILHKQETNSEVAYFFAMNCMAVNDREFYRKASVYFSNVRMKDATNDQLVNAFQTVADVFSNALPLRKQEVVKLQSTFMLCEEEIEALASPQDRCEHAKILLDLYEYHASLWGEQGYEARIRLIKNIQAWQGMDVPLSPDSRTMDELNRRLGMAYYEKGMFLCQRKDYEGMKETFLQALHVFEGLPRIYGEDDVRCATMHLTIFEYGVQDAEKSRHINLLQKALEFCMKGLEKTPQDRSLHQVRSLIEQKIELWR